MKRHEPYLPAFIFSLLLFCLSLTPFHGLASQSRNLSAKQIESSLNALLESLDLNATVVVKETDRENLELRRIQSTRAETPLTATLTRIALGGGIGFLVGDRIAYEWYKRGPTKIFGENLSVRDGKIIYSRKFGARGSSARLIEFHVPRSPKLFGEAVVEASKLIKTQEVKIPIDRLPLGEFHVANVTIEGKALGWNPHWEDAKLLYTIDVLERNGFPTNIEDCRHHPLPEDVAMVTRHVLETDLDLSSRAAVKSFLAESAIQPSETVITADQKGMTIERLTQNGVEKVELSHSLPSDADIIEKFGERIQRGLTAEESKALSFRRFIREKPVTMTGHIGGMVSGVLAAGIVDWYFFQRPEANRAGAGQSSLIESIRFIDGQLSNPNSAGEEARIPLEPIQKFVLAVKNGLENHTGEGPLTIEFLLLDE